MDFMQVLCQNRSLEWTVQEWHLNMSLWKNGKNIFADSKNDLGISEEAFHFMAGVMEHANEMCLITNPLVNSYKRIVPGYEAPVDVSWSPSNRSPLIRVPAARGSGTRLEFRSLILLRILTLHWQSALQQD